MEFVLPNYALCQNNMYCMPQSRTRNYFISKDSGLQSCKLSLNACNYFFPFKPMIHSVRSNLQQYEKIVNRIIEVNGLNHVTIYIKPTKNWIVIQYMSLILDTISCRKMTQCFTGNVHTLVILSFRFDVTRDVKESQMHINHKYSENEL